MMNHRLKIIMWEVLAAVLDCPSLLRYAGEHRRALMPSRRTPTRVYRID